MKIPHQRHKVQAAPKKVPKKKDEQIEKVEPKTVREAAAEKMPDMLKDAGAARQQSIKLDGVAYAGDLAKELLGLAEELEGLYQSMQKALKGQDDTIVCDLLEKLKDKEEANEKAKAGRLGRPPYSVDLHFLMNFVCFSQFEKKRTFLIRDPTIGMNFVFPNHPLRPYKFHL